MTAISTLLVPLQHDFPAQSELRLSHSFVERRLQTGNDDKLLRIVGVTVIRSLLIGKVMSFGCLGDAGLQSAFNRVACEIVSSVGGICRQKQFCLPQTNFG